MHIPDGFISGPINIASAAVVVSVVGYGLHKLKQDIHDQPHKMPLLATTAAFVFAAQMLNFPIGGGTSGHFLGAVTAAALMGPWAALIIMTLVLTIQSAFFADGGITALGTNILNMGVVGGLGGYLLMRGMQLIFPAGKTGYLATVAFTSWASVLLASVLCAIELAVSGTSSLQIALPAMVGTHAIIGIGEALIACAVVTAVIAARPEILHDWPGIEPSFTQPGRDNIRRSSAIIVGGMALALILAALISPFASSYPDGLDKVAEEKEFIEQAASEEQTVWQHSIFPGYTVEAVKQENISTGLAGFAGTGMVFVIGFILIKLMQRRGNIKQAVK
jgi:cobalt/nickel transport system permease protein